MQERRRYIRFTDEASVILKPENNSLSNIKSDLVDISISGMGVFSQENIEIGTKVTFEIITKLWDGPITGEGKVIYVKQIARQDKNVFRVGIDFIKIEKETVKCVINAIQKRFCERGRKKTG
jgi:c-di-GMP-binding flagellar brake protein YcgR